MRQIVYYVAMTVDGYISGPGESIDGYVSSGSGLDQYLADLKEFDTVIMGRKTYEFGYQYGLKPGQKAYEHMDHYIFSQTLKLENAVPGVYVGPLDVALIQDLKKQEGTDIYLCGGGQFAGWCLEHQLIDVLKIKLSPFIYGAGVPLFGDYKVKTRMHLIERVLHDHGLQFLTYQIQY